ncbi:MAG: hypothetical protein DMG14_31720 [Acidobacteria bacterium]|nr:MAG: hypothetical protein DMG14_31720 [Acidobacteriota bacterium]
MRRTRQLMTIAFKLEWQKMAQLFTLESDFLADCFRQVVQHFYKILQNVGVLQQKRFHFEKFLFNPAESRSIFVKVGYE